jgi:hypothetical protein
MPTDAYLAGRERAITYGVREDCMELEWKMYGSIRPNPPTKHKPYLSTEFPKSARGWEEAGWWNFHEWEAGFIDAVNEIRERYQHDIHSTI